VRLGELGEQTVAQVVVAQLDHHDAAHPKAPEAGLRLVGCWLDDRDHHRERIAEQPIRSEATPEGSGVPHSLELLSQALELGGERDGPGNAGSGSFGCLDDVARGFVEQLVVERP